MVLVLVLVLAGPVLVNITAEYVPCVGLDSKGAEFIGSVTNKHIHIQTLSFIYYYTMFFVWTAMLCLAKECLEVVRLCCRTTTSRNC